MNFHRFDVRGLTNTDRINFNLSSWLTQRTGNWESVAKKEKIKFKENNMEKGTLTPRSNGIEVSARFSGAFGQPDGFGSVLTADIRTSGEACLTLNYKASLLNDTEERLWSVMLTNEQRVELAKMLLSYNPTLWEFTKEGKE